MLFRETKFSGVFVIEPQLFKDKRGYFFESFNQRKFNEGIGKEINFVQDNQSQSQYGVLRGLHFQRSPFEQSKLVRVLKGEVLDVAVDLRKDSPTFGKYFSIILNEENKLQLFIPKGFAHGFLVLSPYADFIYKCDNFYAPTHDSGIFYNDPDIGINWKLSNEDIIVSDKDANLTLIRNLDY